MFDRDEMAAMRKLRIGVRIRAVLYLVSGDAARLQTSLDFSAIDRAAPGCDRRIDRLAMLATSRRGRIARVARERFTSHHRAQTAPIVIVAAHNRDPLVIARGRVNAMRRELRIGISDAPLDPSIHRVIENRRAEKVNRAFSLRLIDVLPLASAATMVERR